MGGEHHKEFAKPGAEHARLKRLTGAWAAVIKHWPSADAAPMESKGEYVARMDLGGYFLCREMNFGLVGFQGRGIVGYDPFQRAYLGTWVDSTSPLMMGTKGHFDEKEVFCETSESPNPDGVLVRVRMTTEIVDKNQMLFRIWEVREDGSEWMMLEVDHMRRRFL